MKKTEKYLLKLTENQYDLLKEISEKLDLPISEVIIYALSMQYIGFDKYKNIKEQLIASSLSA